MSIPAYYFLMYNCGHLGDNWSRLNTALRLSQERRVYLQCRYEKCVARVREVLEALEVTGCDLQFASSQPAGTRRITRHVESAASYGTIYFPTKRRHQSDVLSATITYSFDANWRRDEKIPEQVERILDRLSGSISNVRLQRVGLPMSLTELVEVLSTSRLLLSVDNGVAHVARSVGVPLFLLEHRLPVERGFPRSACNYSKVGAADAANTIAEYLRREQLRSIATP